MIAERCFLNYIHKGQRILKEGKNKIEPQHILPSLIFIFLYCKLIIIHFRTQKQRKIKIKLRKKLNHNIYTRERRANVFVLPYSLNQSMARKEPREKKILRPVQADINHIA